LLFSHRILRKAGNKIETALARSAGEGIQISRQDSQISEPDDFTGSPIRF